MRLKRLYESYIALRIIKIFNGCEVLICEVLIENSVTRVTVRHTRLAERCRTVTQVTEFSICTEEPLRIFCFLAYSSFDSYCI